MVQRGAVPCCRGSRVHWFHGLSCLLWGPVLWQGGAVGVVRGNCSPSSSSPLGAGPVLIWGNSRVMLERLSSANWRSFPPPDSFEGPHLSGKKKVAVQARVWHTESGWRRKGLRCVAVTETPEPPPPSRPKNFTRGLGLTRGGGLASEQVPPAHRLAALDRAGEQLRALPAGTAARGDVPLGESSFLPSVISFRV